MASICRRGNRAPSRSAFPTRPALYPAGRQSSGMPSARQRECAHFRQVRDHRVSWPQLERSRLETVLRAGATTVDRSKLPLTRRADDACPDDVPGSVPTTDQFLARLLAVRGAEHNSEAFREFFGGVAPSHATASANCEISTALRSIHKSYQAVKL